MLDPEPDPVHAAADLGVDRIEPYARAFGTPTEDAVFDTYHCAAVLATARGLGVNAGHDLNLDNLPRLATLPGLLEVSIGHAPDRRRPLPRPRLRGPRVPGGAQALL